jgi:carbohydrate kinase (thermoresistant glucokinase family)
MTRAVPAGGPIVLVLMGVAGCGKTTTAARLSRRLGWEFRDADAFHPSQNIAKMSAGVPLTDDDRWPWLAAIADWIDARLAAGESAIVTCSALKRAYRDVLAGGRARVQIVHLAGSQALIGARMAARRNHFMPPSLLDSQFAALEPPAADEKIVEVPVSLSPGVVTDRIIAVLELTEPA